MARHVHQLRPLSRLLTVAVVALAVASYLLLPAILVAHVAVAHGGHAALEDDDGRPTTPAGTPHAVHCELCLLLGALGHSGEPPVVLALFGVGLLPRVTAAVVYDQVSSGCRAPVAAYPRAPPLV